MVLGRLEVPKTTNKGRQGQGDDDIIMKKPALEATLVEAQHSSMDLKKRKVEL
jgi:hypothetical protein